MGFLILKVVGYLYSIKTTQKIIMKNFKILSLLLALSLGWWLSSCDPTEPQSVKITAEAFRITHSGDNYVIQIGKNNPQSNGTNVAIGTTDISDTGAVAIGTTDISDTGAVFIGTTDISDMGGTVVLADNSILAFTYNNNTGMMETFTNLPGGVVKKECYPLTVTIVVAHGFVNVRNSDGSINRYDATANVVFIKHEGNQICIYTKAK